MSLIKKKYINYINHVVRNSKISHAYLFEVENYDDDFGLWHDQSMNLSTQKDLEQFADENLMVPVTITEESDQEYKTGEKIHIIKFEYTNGSQKVYGSFSVRNDINYISLNIYG